MIKSIGINLNNEIKLFANTEEAINFCSDPNFLRVMKILGTVITILKILVPVILIIIATSQLSKVIISGEDTTSTINNLIQKLIVGVIIFFIPGIIGAILSTVKGYNNAKNQYTNCGICLTKAQSSECSSLISTAKAKKEAISKAKKEKKAQERAAAKEKYKVKKVVKPTKKVSVGGISNSSNLPYYNQGSPAYAKISLPSGRVYSTSSCGCGYTSLAMVIDGLTGQNNTPTGIVRYFNPSSYASGFCAINDATLVNSAIKTHFGVNYNTLFGRASVSQSGADAQSRKQAIVNSLQSGHAIVLLIPGHYIALGGIQNGKISVLDPGNSANNGSYTIDELWNKYYNHKNRCSSRGKCGFMYAVEYSR